MGETLHPMLAGPGGPLLGGLEQFLEILVRPDLLFLVPPRVVRLGHFGQLRIYGLGPGLLGLDACRQVPCLHLTRSLSPLPVRRAFASLGPWAPSHQWRTNF
jgi:hypothetical protein